jgi:predicted enzyme related to lactoylglutathione lyase
MGRVIHFEIEADDLARAERFYTELFGWEFFKWDGPVEYWLIGTGDRSTPGIDGAMMPRTHPKAEGAEPPIAAFVCTIEVDDIDAAVARLPELGGERIGDVNPIPGVGRQCYAKDTEGNLIGLMESDPNRQPMM